MARWWGNLKSNFFRPPLFLEMGKPRRTSRSRALSMLNVPNSSSPTKSTRHSPFNTSFGTTVTNSLSYQGNSATPRTTTTVTSSQHPEGDSCNKILAPIDHDHNLEPINENDYIRAKLTLPTNEVISILMKKDQKWTRLLNAPKQIEADVNETGDSHLPRSNSLEVRTNFTYQKSYLNMYLPPLIGM